MNRQQKKLKFEAFVSVNSNIAYASSKNFNGLFRIDLKSNNCSYVSLFPNEKAGGKRLHCKAECSNNKIYFIPGSADYISIIDLQTKEIYQIMIPSPTAYKKFYKKNYKFADSCIHDNCLWLLPATFPGLLKMDIDSEDITVIDYWVPNNGYVFRKGMCKFNDLLFLPDSQSNAIIEINMQSSQVRVSFVGKNNKGCWSACLGDDENIWLAPRNPGPIIKWNYKRKTFMEYSDYPKGYSHNNFAFTKVYSVGENIYFIPAFSNMMIKFDINKNIMSEINDNIFNHASYCEYLFETESFIYINVVYEEFERIYKIAKNTNEISVESFVFSEGVEERNRDYMEAEIQSSVFVKENETFGLEQFIQIHYLDDEE